MYVPGRFVYCICIAHRSFRSFKHIQPSSLTFLCGSQCRSRMAEADPGATTPSGGDNNTESKETEKRPQFGNRLLTDARDVFEHNAWDNVVWDEEQEASARKTTAEQLAHLVPDDKQKEYEEDADKFWDKFYTIHQNQFFKDRNWLFTEFPELALTENKQTDTDIKQHTDSSGSDQPDRLCSVESENISQHDKSDTSKLSGGDNSLAFPGSSAKYRIFEVGCGVGNTVFPILQTNNNPDLMVYCCDLSETAINLVKEHHDYEGGRCHAFVSNITDEGCALPFPENSLDIVILIFILSAVSPEKMQGVINRLARHLKPGGTILFRDYGRYDLAQLRFKKGKCLSENFYVRGDGTRVYFFTQDDLKTMFEKAGLEEKSNIIDRRLQVNRGRQLKMYRVWIQCKYTKPLKPAEAER